ncbi:MAG: phosphate regulon transcriptional regulator PhoB [Alphaproteobacteria bacterium]|nr:phosphate regulon transcriptional regulator PhoB [Alphaproteobacteria bacterium]
MISPTSAMILVVEDELAQLELLTYNLKAAGFQTATAGDGEEALVLVEEVEPDLIVLDWMLPKVSGIEVCRTLKRQSQTQDIPIMMLTARGEEADRVRGLDTGADDYITKPYSLNELVARVRAILRRTRPGSVSQTLSYGGIKLDLEEHKVTREGVGVKLGPTEFRLLSTFLERPGRVWSRESLLDRVWGREKDVDLRTVDVHVGRLRKALSLNDHPDVIRTVRGAGYALDKDED